FAGSVTYPGIGTFYSSDFYHPIYRPFGFLYLPASPTEIMPDFYLYTRANPQLREQLRWNNTEDIRKSKYFNASLPTKFIVHGFMENHKFLHTKWKNQIKNRLLDYAPFNVILVDWRKGNVFPYTQAACNTRVIGPMIAIQI